jgi:signal peptidase I
VTPAFHRIALQALTWVQLAGVVVLVGLSALLMAGILPTVFGNESLAVSTRGMQPEIQLGSLAVVSPVKVEDLSVGDVIIYRRPEEPEFLVLQRLLSVDNDQPNMLNLQVRGDSQPVAEQVSVATGIRLGRVVYSIPYLGRLVDFVNQFTGKLLLFGVPGVLLCVDYLLSHLHRRRPPATSNTPDHSQRVESLLEYARRALLAAQPELAIRAARGALLLDPRNEAASGLAAQALKALDHALEHAAA